ncbi:hypothetical protein [Kineothrix sedimenti]|uniref:Uncharacterized protein n=1 Tax=Kineothrix sedimenti TaxID=3123317 RepID=A0ABZ3F372_9FIRM
MGLLDDLKLMQSKVDKIPKTPRYIEVTEKIYRLIKKASEIDELLYGKPKFIYPFCGVTLRVVTCDDQKQWTEEEMERQFKVVY